MIRRTAVLTVNSDGSFTYTPTTGYTGSDSFGYEAYNGFAYSSTATVSITVNTPPAPTASDDSYSGYVNHTLTVAAASGLLLNDTDSTGLSLTANKVSDPSHGSVTVNSDGSFTYTPTTGYAGTDSFGYKAYNGFVYGNTANVSISVNQPTRILVSCGNTYPIYSNTTNTDGRYWNGFTAYTGSPSVITSCTTSTGSLSGIALTRTADFPGATFSTAVTGPINGWPKNAAKECLYTSSTTVASTMQFSIAGHHRQQDLRPDRVWIDRHSGTTHYTVLASSTTSQDIATNSNTTIWATFSNLTPDSNGKITLQVLELKSGGNGGLNVMDLAIYNNGGGMGRAGPKPRLCPGRHQRRRLR